jgi:hypothetical protein
MKDSLSQLDNTDELPVLSEEAFRRIHLTDADTALARIDSALAGLTDALDRTEKRWQYLENRLETQFQAIHELSCALDSKTDGDQQPVAPVTRPSTANIAKLKFLPAAPESAAGADRLATDTEAAASKSERLAEQNLRERIASLENYICGRVDHWRDMEALLDRQARRIAELESSLDRKNGAAVDKA